MHFGELHIFLFFLGLQSSRLVYQINGLPGAGWPPGHV